MKYPLLLLLISCTVLTACDDSAVLDKFVPIADHAWKYDEPVSVEAHIADRRPYRIYLNLRHTPDYRYSNIFMRITFPEQGGKDTTERVELTLATPDGRWLGSGTGNLYTHQQLIKDQFVFPDTGQFIFKIEQNMRENPLSEISDVGLRIVPVE